MTFDQACESARKESEADRCTKHVYCTVRLDQNGRPYIVEDRWCTSDWYDGSVVVSYTNGRRDA